MEREIEMMRRNRLLDLADFILGAGDAGQPEWRGQVDVLYYAIRLFGSYSSAREQRREDAKRLLFLSEEQARQLFDGDGDAGREACAAAVRRMAETGSADTGTAEDWRHD